MYSNSKSYQSLQIMIKTIHFNFWYFLSFTSYYWIDVFQVTYLLLAFLHWACCHKCFHRSLLRKALNCDSNLKLFYCDFFKLFCQLEAHGEWGHWWVCFTELLALLHSFCSELIIIQCLDSFAFMWMDSTYSCQQTKMLYFLKFHMMMFCYWADYLSKMNSKTVSI